MIQRSPRIVRKLVFKERPGNTDPRFDCYLDGVEVCADIKNTDISGYELDPVWEALGITVEFVEANDGDGAVEWVAK